MVPAGPEAAVQLWSQISAYVGKLPGALITLGAGALLLRFLKGAVARAAALARLDPTLRGLLQSAVGFAGWVLVIAAVLNALGLSQISLALGGSIALIVTAIVTGLNTLAQDLLAGIFLISDSDFRVGARVRAAGLEGVVEQLTIRKTKIRDASGLLHVVPNRNIDAATYTILAPPGASWPAAGEGPGDASREAG